jgi:hypothetical protein
MALGIKHLPFAALFLLLGAAAPPDASTLSMSGLGDVHIGMTLAQLDAMGRDVAPDDVAYDPAHPEGCWEGRIEGVDHVIAMFDDNHLVRLTATSADIPIEGGARIGMAEPAVQALYGGRLAVEPHGYDPDGHYLVAFSEDRSRALVMETDGAKVTLVRAGEAKAAQSVEGCN